MAEKTLSFGFKNLNKDTMEKKAGKKSTGERAFSRRAF
jgi:hypothetical protein